MGISANFTWTYWLEVVVIGHLGICKNIGLYVHGHEGFSLGRRYRCRDTEHVGRLGMWSPLDRENWAQRKWPSWETRKIFCRTKSLLVSGLKTLHTGVFVF